eukprot:CAMPEP_0180276362 /NCGR_PEP_ID=MMETSP0988-20121125/6319_1 /TAXON_ID=697907 /ORGANISM="non described non described, Strain CCMP2293" /LENGTH=121 /DNA_ID=CAMNT_0022247657 /DNA_START=175 /DNA_END=536 /DNA_ORIENTATION=+
MAVQDMEVDAARGAGSHGVGGAGKEIAEASARKWRQIEEAAGDVNALEASEEWGEARQRAERVLSVEVAGMDVAAYDAAQGGPVRKMISLDQSGFAAACQVTATRGQRCSTLAAGAGHAVL